ncbi:hypothetical protein [Actinomyces sp. S4-C9]|uniref:hypothetical protein n=1 Tax=Actinomyces sp. S4-C9 TaxID=1219581 RepID=UPI0012EB3E55
MDNTLRRSRLQCPQASGATANTALKKLLRQNPTAAASSLAFSSKDFMQGSLTAVVREFLMGKKYKK